MRRAALLVALLAVVASGCGGGAPDDPGAAVIAKLVDAAREGDAAAMWELLSPESRRRVGPTEQTFAANHAKVLARKLAPFADGYELAVSEKITDGFGLVAIDHGRSAFAIPLRLDGNDWKVEHPGPVTVDVLGPRPGTRQPVGQVGVEVHAPGGVSGVSLIYVDGSTLDARTYSGPKGATVFANLPELLPAGQHTAVAYADLGDEAGATAWTFTATKPAP
jgi:hypothetical protein